MPRAFVCVSVLTSDGAGFQFDSAVIFYRARVHECELSSSRHRRIAELWPRIHCAHTEIGIPHQIIQIV